MLDLLPDVASLRDYSLGPVWYSLTLALSVPLCLPSPPFEIVGGYIFSPSVAMPASSHWQDVRRLFCVFGLSQRCQIYLARCRWMAQ